MTFTPEQLEFLRREVQARIDTCSTVLTDNYLAQFPIADTPDNLAARRKELTMLTDLLGKLEGGMTL